MAISSLQQFLDITCLKTQPNYVSNLLKTADSKNITIEEWNTLISQLRALISQNADTYAGFEHVLNDLHALDKPISDVESFIRNLVETMIASERVRSDNLYANALRTTKSGTELVIDDASPLPHTVSVTLTSDSLPEDTVVTCTVESPGIQEFTTVLNEGFEFISTFSAFTISSNTEDVTISCSYNLDVRTLKSENGNSPKLKKLTEIWNCWSDEDISESLVGLKSRLLFIEAIENDSGTRSSCFIRYNDNGESTYSPVMKFPIGAEGYFDLSGGYLYLNGEASGYGWSAIVYDTGIEFE